MRRAKACAIVPFVEYYLQLYTKPGQRVLDVGCGTAPYRFSTDALYIGLDVTDAPYRMGFPRNVDVVASAEDVPVRDASFDLVFSVAAFYQIPDPQKALHEFLRVLKPGGRLLIVDYNRRTQKRLVVGEGQARPCWTQWGLKRLLGQSGLRQCELFLPVTRETRPILKGCRLLLQELLGRWAIATGIK